MKPEALKRSQELLKRIEKCEELLDRIASEETKYVPLRGSCWLRLEPTWTLVEIRDILKFILGVLVEEANESLGTL